MGRFSLSRGQLWRKPLGCPRFNRHHRQLSVEFFYRGLVPRSNRFPVVLKGEFSRMMPQGSLHVRNVAIEHRGERGPAHAEGEIGNFGPVPRSFQQIQHVTVTSAVHLAGWCLEELVVFVRCQPLLQLGTD